MATFGVNQYFKKKFKFLVEIDGVTYAGFMSCSEIGVDVAEIVHWEGGALEADKSPGRVTYPDVTLERGATDDFDLWTWMTQVMDASAMVEEPAHQRHLDVVELTRRGTELNRWTLRRTWPKKFVAGSWDNNSDENTVTKLVLSVGSFGLGGDNPA